MHANELERAGAEPSLGPPRFGETPPGPSEPLVLEPEDAEAVLKALNDPPPPNEAALKAAREFRALYG